MPGAWTLGFMVAATLITGPGPLFGQDLLAPNVAVMAGAVSYDMDTLGDGRTAFAGIRVRFPLSRHVLLEPSLAYAVFSADTVGRGGDEDTPLFTTEFQVQLQMSVDRLRPYVGLGAGGVLDLRDDRGRTPEGGQPADFLVSTYSAALGVGIDLAAWSLRGEVRRRWLDDFDDSAVELSLALARAF